MKDKIDLYKKVSLELLELLKNERLDNIDDKLEKRQIILKHINNIEEFRQLAHENGVVELEIEISQLFNTKVNKAKQELVDYRRSKVANNTYANLSKEKLNIFNKKV